LGVVHRDIKPENIIITPDRETAYVVDFGIALSAEDAKRLTSSGFVIGTPGYMSPEQEGGESLDGRTDIYSLGVTLYEVLAARRIPVGHYEPLSSTNEAIPPQVDELIEDCLLPRDQRLDGMRVFTSRLSGALQPAKPLSDVLAHGRLHELALSIEVFTASDFINLPEGQRSLILTKIVDIIHSGDPKLDFACERLIEIVLTRGLLLEKEEYREIVEPAIRWAFEKEFGSYVGRPSIRRALEEAASEARSQAHEVLKQEFASYLSGVNLQEKEEWYLHGVREVLVALLANPAAASGTADLVKVLRSVNKIQRSKSTRQYNLLE
jgi:serine/threonine protein kinase